MATKEDEAAFEEELDTIRTRCWTLRRHAPERSGCGFCGKIFEASAHTGPNDSEGKAEERAWEERMEHLGKHYERDGCIPGSEAIDQHLLRWGLDEGILCEVNDVGVWLVGYELPNTSAGNEANGENDLELGLKREGLRRRGPRRRADVGTAVAVAVLPHRPVHVQQEDDDGSDADAMAEDE